MVAVLVMHHTFSLLMLMSRDKCRWTSPGQAENNPTDSEPQSKSGADVSLQPAEEDRFSVSIAGKHKNKAGQSRANKRAKSKDGTCYVKCKLQLLTHA